MAEGDGVLVKRPKLLGSIEYSAGAKRTLEIDRDGVLAELSVRLAFTNTNTATPPTGVRMEALARLIENVEIKINGRDTVVNLPGYALAVLAHYDFGGPPLGMDATVDLTGSAATAYDIVIPIPRYLPRGRRPDDTMDDVRRVESATISITWAAANPLFNTANAAAISAVTCQVEAKYLRGVPAAQVFNVRELSLTEATINATSQNFEVILDRGTGIIYRRFMILATEDDIGSNNIINSLDLISGSFTFQDVTEEFLRAAVDREYRPATFKTGAYIIDTAMFGERTSNIPTDRLQAALRFLFDVTNGGGVTKLAIVREAIRPVRV